MPGRPTGRRRRRRAGRPARRRPGCPDGPTVGLSANGTATRASVHTAARDTRRTQCRRGGANPQLTPARGSVRDGGERVHLRDAICFRTDRTVAVGSAALDDVQRDLRGPVRSREQHLDRVAQVPPARRLREPRREACEVDRVRRPRPRPTSRRGCRRRAGRRAAPRSSGASGSRRAHAGGHVVDLPAGVHGTVGQVADERQVEERGGRLRARHQRGDVGALVPHRVVGDGGVLGVHDRDLSGSDDGGQPLGRLVGSHRPPHARPRAPGRPATRPDPSRPAPASSRRRRGPRATPPRRARAAPTSSRSRDGVRRGRAAARPAGPRRRTAGPAPAPTARAATTTCTTARAPTTRRAPGRRARGAGPARPRSARAPPATPPGRRRRGPRPPRPPRRTRRHRAARPGARGSRPSRRATARPASPSPSRRRGTEAGSARTSATRTSTRSARTPTAVSVCAPHRSTASADTVPSTRSSSSCAAGEPGRTRLSAGVRSPSAAGSGRSPSHGSASLGRVARCAAPTRARTVSTTSSVSLSSSARSHAPPAGRRPA